ncbi:MAG: hypothetical protein KC502_00730 [Myxococcales bacterium]|nr:hypothetical protein [Myxococcales bacterium]
MVASTAIMAPMVPVRHNALKSIGDTTRRRVRSVRRLLRPLVWAWALWAVTVAVPYLWLYPGQRLTRPVCMVLVGLPLLLTTLSAALAQARTLLVTGLGSLIPPLVACPELLGPRVTSPLQGLAVAGLLLTFIAATVDAERGKRATANERLRSLLRADGGWLLPGIGAVWLLGAWFGGPDRTRRVAAVAVCWVAVYSIGLGKSAVRYPRPAWWLVRGGALVALAVFWRWWS